MRKTTIMVAGFASMTMLLAACGGSEPAQPRESAKSEATAADAQAFVAQMNADIRRLNQEGYKAAWIAATHITPDSQYISAKANEEWLNWMAKTVEASKRFTALDLTGETARAIKLIQTGATMPAPSDPAKIAELAQIAAELEAMYGSGKYCPADEAGKCYSLGDLENIIDDPSASYERKLMAWQGWRTISPPMREKYTRFVELTNEGAKELGFADTGTLWRSGYDMPADEFAQVTEKLWSEVEPLYDALHCYVRDKLTEQYGEDKVIPGEPIPAHLLGNMWAQEWGNTYPMMEPYKGVSDLDVTATLEARRQKKEDELMAGLGKSPSPEDIVEARREADKFIAVEMVKSAENFYTSLGFEALPESFWTQSMFIKPRDREVVCHASAWDMDPQAGDVRIKMCIEPNFEDLKTIYHELGHIFYYLAYDQREPIFQSGAHDGFHEAIGDTIELAMTPEYLASQGLIESVSQDEKAVINNQMKQALDKVAFLPFGKLIDQWRWKVFAGEVTPENYNAAWWELRTKYQGIAAPVQRSEADFDPGAKYHIPGNTPYTRYFLARVLQFQFYQSLCDAAGHAGPLNQCSFYGSKQAGEKFWAMMEKGQNQPWQETLFELTGTREMSGAPMLEYFAPLKAWLDEENKNSSCGW